MHKKHGIVGIEDVDLLILAKLNDKDLLSFCSVDKYANDLCKNEIFWKRRVFEKLGDIKKDEKRTWRDLYLKIIYYKYLYLSPYEILSKLYEKGLTLQSDLVSYFISMIEPDIISKLIYILTTGRAKKGLRPLTTEKIKKSFKRINEVEPINRTIITAYNRGKIKLLERPSFLLFDDDDE